MVDWASKLPSHFEGGGPPTPPKNASPSGGRTTSQAKLPSLPPQPPPKEAKAANRQVMDFFARFTKGGRPRSKQDTLARFQKCWRTIEDTLSDFSGKLAEQVPPVEKTDIPVCMQELVKMLLYEDKSNAPDDPTGPCMEELLNRNILDDLVKYSYANIPVGVVRETVKLFSDLVNSPLQARFLTQGNVHGPLNRLLRSLDWDKLEAYEDEVMDFLYGICEKIHEYPELLYIFFEPVQTNSGPSVAPAIARSQSGATAAAQLGPFPLLGLLLRHLQAPTKSGDIARTAIGKLLELPELASPGSDLETFVVEGANLPELLIASLGASWAYCFGAGSPSERASRADADGELRAPQRAGDSKVSVPRRSADSSRNSPSKSGQLGGSGGTSAADPLSFFISLLQFIQSIMSRTPSQRLAQAIASEFDSHFLSAILYETVLATHRDSDSLGASAKLTGALARMVATVEEAASARPGVEPQFGLIDSIVRFLLGGQTNTEFAGDKAGVVSVRTVLLSMIADDRDELAVPALRLLDSLCSGSRGPMAVQLLVQSLPSWSHYGDQGTVSAENRAILQRMKLEAVPQLARWLALLPDDEADSAPGTPSGRRSASPSPPGLQAALAFVDPTQMIPYSAADSDPSGGTQDQSGGHDKEDGTRTLTTYVEATESKLLWISRPESPEPGNRAVEDESPVDVEVSFDDVAFVGVVSGLRVLASDPVLSLLLSLLAGFFKRSFEYNLALTGLIHSVAAAPFPVLYGFFVSGDQYGTDEDDGEPSEESSAPSSYLYPILSFLVNVAEEKKMTVISGSCKELLAEARHAIAYPPVGVPNPALKKRIGYEENERKKAQWKNVVVLEASAIHHLPFIR
ncbi:Retinoic acid induced 16-like protein-domain-containing protein [Hyaloraphidium curvatum]|nr:Retinoic acid induced 16-like protein-domain-containing protein [Hyaloraphidium curvatum]